MYSIIPFNLQYFVFPIPIAAISEARRLFRLTQRNLRLTELRQGPSTNVTHSHPCNLYENNVHSYLSSRISGASYGTDVRRVSLVNGQSSWCDKLWYSAVSEAYRFKWNYFALLAILCLRTVEGLAGVLFEVYVRWSRCSVYYGRYVEASGEWRVGETFTVGSPVDDVRVTVSC